MVLPDPIELLQALHADSQSPVVPPCSSESDAEMAELTPPQPPPFVTSSMPYGPGEHGHWGATIFFGEEGPLRWASSYVADLNLAEVELLYRRLHGQIKVENLGLVNDVIIIFLPFW